MTSRSIGLLGCGPWGRLILRDLRALGAEVHVWSPGAASRAAALAGGARTVHEHLDAMPEVEGIVIATTTSTHAASIRAVAARGVPIFVEKPMCIDAIEAERLADEFGDRLFVMDKWRYHTGVRTLSALAADGVLGEVVGVQCVRIGYADNHPDVDAAWILLPHDLSIAYEITGTVGGLRHAVGHVDEAGNVRTISALFDEPGGLWFATTVSDRSPVERREVHVVGSGATAVLSGGFASYVEVRRGATVEQIAFEPNMPLFDELAAFLVHLDGGPSPVSSARDGARTVALVAAARSAVGAWR
jgi:predicted dehydrogenase